MRFRLPFRKISPQPDFRLTINADDQRVFGPCACCGNMTQRAWGYVNEGEVVIAAYFVEWTLGHTDDAANFDLILGRWGPESASQDRKAVALEFRRVQGAPFFRIINAAERAIATSSLVGDVLTREEVLATPVANTVFAICDAIFLNDHRIAQLSSGA